MGTATVTVQPRFCQGVLTTFNEAKVLGSFRYCAGWTEERVRESLTAGSTEARVCMLSSGNHRVCAQLDHAGLTAIPYTQSNNQWVQDTSKSPIKISLSDRGIEQELRDIAGRFFPNFGWECLECKQTCADILNDLDSNPMESRLAALGCYYYKDELQASGGCKGIVAITCWDGTLEVPYIDCKSGALLLVARARVIPDNAVFATGMSKGKASRVGRALLKLRWNAFRDFISSK